MGAGRAGDEPLESLLKTAEGWKQAGRLLDARAAFMTAAAMAEESGDKAALVTAALGAGGIWVHEQRDVVGVATMHGLWERAQAVAMAGSFEEACLAVRVAAEEVYEGAAVDTVLDAVDRVRGFRNDAATAQALSLLHHVHLAPRYAESRLGLADEIVRLGARSGDTVAALVGLCWRTVDLFLLGDPRANQSLAELRERTEAARCEALCFIADVLTAMMLARAGRLGDAEEAATLASERGTAAGDTDAPAYYGAMLAGLRWWQGRLDEIVDMVRAMSTSPRLGHNDHVYVAAYALMSATLGDVDSAEEALARLSRIGLGRLPESSTWLTTQLLVAETAYLLGDAEVAGQANELLAPFAHLPVMPSLAVMCFGSAERGLGVTAATTGRLDEAVRHLDAALHADRRLGSRPMATLTEHTLAAVLRARHAPGDETRAEELATRAEARADGMGMVLPGHPSWMTVPEAATRPTRCTHEAVLEACPGGWRIDVDNHSALIPHRVGFTYLAELISRPGRDIDVINLVSRPVFRSQRSDAVLDEAAMRGYRRRTRELTTLLANEGLSAKVADGYRHELAALTEALASATGLGGRVRNFPDIHERARTAVRKALTRAVAAIAAVEPELGRHLQTSLTTGATCRYAPASDWAVAVRTPAREQRA